ncbi:MAG: NADH-quinone oxidoreductase subunit H, partial [Polyangiaceae bacterium]|nr:NADH-quinone oxidoreductase subunit H [Polyangiaceae bacterium]
MTSVDIVFTLIKIVIILGFVVTGAAVGTWADRRQGAMVQDRVGPNRAVFHLPSGVA